MRAEAQTLSRQQSTATTVGCLRIALEAQSVVALDELESDCMAHTAANGRSERGILVELCGVEFWWTEDVVVNAMSLRQHKEDETVLTGPGVRGFVFPSFVETLAKRICTVGGNVQYALSTCSPLLHAAAEIAAATGTATAASSPSFPCMLLPSPHLFLHTSREEVLRAVRTVCNPYFPAPFARACGPVGLLAVLLGHLIEVLGNDSIATKEAAERACSLAMQSFSNTINMQCGLETQQLPIAAACARALILELLPEAFGFRSVESPTAEQRVYALRHTCVGKAAVVVDSLARAGLAEVWRAECPPGDHGNSEGCLYMQPPYELLLRFLCGSAAITLPLLLRSPNLIMRLIRRFLNVERRVMAKFLVIELWAGSLQLKTQLEMLLFSRLGCHVKALTPKSVKVVESAADAIQSSMVYLTVRGCRACHAVSFAEGPCGTIRVLWRTCRKRAGALGRTYKEHCAEVAGYLAHELSGMRDVHVFLSADKISEKVASDICHSRMCAPLHGGQSLFTLPVGICMHRSPEKAFRALCDFTSPQDQQQRQENEDAQWDVPSPCSAPQLADDDDVKVLGVIPPVLPLKSDPPVFQTHFIKVDFYEITNFWSPESRTFLDTVSTSESMKDACLSFLRRLHHSTYAAAFCVISTRDLSYSEPINVVDACRHCSYTLTTPDRAIAVFVPKAEGGLQWYLTQGNAGWADSQYVTDYS
eukprot:TRINITY_DN1795_c0_g1_i2.p1 TRINITY_DN1795_c0_g1~~TRINITY_DN1795_c0_g1_i2.p1  ORF type:complete len:705 (-),score=156.22 TRINITY_DN1795_c0_g1_i2:78-2192(-)